MKAIDINELNYEPCYELNRTKDALIEIDILDGEYCGKNSRPPIQAIDVVPRLCIDKLLRIFEGIAAMDGTCSAHYVVRTIHNCCDKED